MQARSIIQAEKSQQTGVFNSRGRKTSQDQKLHVVRKARFRVVQWIRNFYWQSCDCRRRYSTDYVSVRMGYGAEAYNKDRDDEMKGVSLATMARVVRSGSVAITAPLI